MTAPPLVGCVVWSLFLIMIFDIDKDGSASKLVRFADDTRLYSGVEDVADCDNLQLDLNELVVMLLSHLISRKLIGQVFVLLLN